MTPVNATARTLLQSVCMGKRNGFTTIEFMVVVLVIGILVAIGSPQFVKARESSRARTCASGLRQLDSAKAQWALEHNKKETETPTQAEVMAYLKVYPECPSGGVLTINAVGQAPTCSYGHAY